MKHAGILIGFAVMVLAGCSTTPKQPPEVYGSDLDSVEQYITDKYNPVFETDFIEPDKAIGVALNGTLSVESGKAVFAGTAEPHSILFVFDAIGKGQACYIRYKPVSGKWYAVNIESGEYQTSSFDGISIMRNPEMVYEIYVTKGTNGVRKYWSKRQFNFKNTEFLILFEMDLEGKRIVRMFDDKGRYNTYIGTDIAADTNANMLFKVQSGKSEMLRFKKLEYK